MLVWVVDLVAAGWRRKQKELMFFFVLSSTGIFSALWRKDEQALWLPRCERWDWRPNTAAGGEGSEENWHLQQWMWWHDRAQPLWACLTGCKKDRNTDQLTHSRSFSSGPWLCSSVVQEPFGPQLMEYEIRLSLGQSSSRGKPITLTNRSRETGCFFVLNKSSCLNQALLMVDVYTVVLLLSLE